FVYKAIILRTHPEILKKRLKQKKYSIKKIAENLQAEILGDCSFHAYSSYGIEKVFELDNSEISIEKTLDLLISIVKNEKIKRNFKKIDWLETLEKDNTLTKYFEV
ncbi:MAG: hypothetical protein ACFFCM_12525, partial [Promethearchaeota archaeon]